MNARDVIAVGAMLLLVSSVAAAPDRVELRNGDIIEGRVATIDAGGVSMRRAFENGGSGGAGAGEARGLEATDRIAWDRIARLERDGAGGAGTDADVARWLERGERLWRARARLARGDAVLAEQALGPAWSFEVSDGPTGLVAALVELQVSLSRADHPRAWRAWFEVMRARRAGLRDPALETWLEPSARGTMIRRLLVDDATGLCPSLPPFVVDAEQRTRVLAVLDGFDPRGDRSLDGLRRALAAVIDPSREPPPEAADAKNPPASPPSEGDDRQAIEFLRVLRALQHGTPAERAAARDGTAVQRRRLPEWAEAWWRFAAGSGLLLDGTPTATLAGQIELMHLPARFTEMQPWLSSRAAFLAAEASRRDGRENEAARITPFITPPHETP